MPYIRLVITSVIYSEVYFRDTERHALAHTSYNELGSEGRSHWSPMV